MRVKLLVVILILLLCPIVFGVGVLAGALLGPCIREALITRPAAEEKPPEEKDPTYGLPLEITIEDIPQVPKEIQGPMPPIKERKPKN